MGAKCIDFDLKILKLQMNESKRRRMHATKKSMLLKRHFLKQTTLTSIIIPYTAREWGGGYI